MIAFGRISGKRDCKYNTVNKTDFDWIIMHLSNHLFTENVARSLYGGWPEAVTIKLAQKVFRIY